MKTDKNKIFTIADEAKNEATVLILDDNSTINEGILAFNGCTDCEGNNLEGRKEYFIAHDYYFYKYNDKYIFEPCNEVHEKNSIEEMVDFLYNFSLDFGNN